MRIPPKSGLGYTQKIGPKLRAKHDRELQPVEAKVIKDDSSCTGGVRAFVELGRTIQFLQL